LKSFKDQYLDWEELAKSIIASEVDNLGNFRGLTYDGLALAGMGGSGIACDVIYSELKNALSIPITIVKDFTLPYWVRKGWLVIAISYSGNTLETLSLVDEAIRRGAAVAAVSSDGSLIKKCDESKLPYIKIPEGRAPRTSFPALVGGVVKLLHELKIYDFLDEFKDGLHALRNIDEAERASEELSDFLEGTIPVFISDQDHYPLALRAKDEINENAKTPSLVHIYPESAHNDIVSWDGWFGPLSAVILDTGNSVLGYIGSYIMRAGVPTKIIKLTHLSNYFGRALWWSQVIGLTSVRLAWRRGIDPEKTKAIAEYKEFLRKNILRGGLRTRDLVS
jgi:glucose/mannose-6-phosphate isomerase